MASVYLCRERFHAKQWHLKFSPPMIEFRSKYLFVGDFVLFQHSDLGRTMGKIERFFTKVICYVSSLFALTSNNS